MNCSWQIYILALTSGSGIILLFRVRKRRIWLRQLMRKASYLARSLVWINYIPSLADTNSPVECPARDCKQYKAGNKLWRNNEGRSRNHWCRWKAISITCSVCVSVALGIQHAVRTRCIILQSVACPPPFHTVSHYYTDGKILGKKLLNTKCVSWFSLQSFFWNIFHSTNNSAMYHTFTNVFMWSVCYYYCQIFMKFKLSRQIFETII